jgi:hypothetical protein
MDLSRDRSRFRPAVATIENYFHMLNINDIESPQIRFYDIPPIKSKKFMCRPTTPLLMEKLGVTAETHHYLTEEIQKALEFLWTQPFCELCVDPNNTEITDIPGSELEFDAWITIVHDEPVLLNGSTFRLFLPRDISDPSFDGFKSGLEFDIFDQDWVDEF